MYKYVYVIVAQLPAALTSPKPARQTVNIFLLTAHTHSRTHSCVCRFLWSGDKLRELSISAKW